MDVFFTEFVRERMKEGGSMAHKGNGGRALKHVHNYQLTRTRSEVRKQDNEIVVFRFYICTNRDTPCPERDKLEIERRPIE